MPDRVERVFVGEVVADVDRQEQLPPVELVENPFQCLALAPVDIRPEFDDHPPAGDTKIVALSDDSHGGGDSVDTVGGDVSIMHGDGEALVLHDESADIGQAFAKFGLRIRKNPDRFGADLVLVVCPIGGQQFETMAARIPDAGHADSGLDVVQSATTDHRDRAARGQRLEHVGGTRYQRCGIGIVDDLRHSAVEVQQHRGLSRLCERGDLAVGLQRIRHRGGSFVAAAKRHGDQIGYHDIGAGPQEFVGVAGAVDTDDESEAAVASRRHACHGILDDDAPLGPYREPLRGLVQDGRVGFTGKAQLAGGQPVDPDGKQLGKPCGLQDVCAVAARRENGRADLSGLELTDKLDGRSEGRHAVGEQLEEAHLFVVSQAAHRVDAAVVLAPPRKSDAA